MPTVYVGEPGYYGLVRSDGSLRLHIHRRAAGHWPIWYCAVHPGKTGFTWSRQAYEFQDPFKPWLLSRITGFGSLSPEARSQTLRAYVDARTWWTDTRSSKTTRAMYLPAMQRGKLIELVTSLEQLADEGQQQINHKPIGVWIRRVWNVIEERERVE